MYPTIFITVSRSYFFHRDFSFFLSIFLFSLLKYTIYKTGRVSSPIMRKLHRQLLDDNGNEVIVLPTKDDHVFFLRTNYPESQSPHHYYPGSQHKVNGDMVTKGRDNNILASGPGTITIHSDEVAIIYKLDVATLRNGFGAETSNETSSTKPLRSKSLPVSKVSKVSNIVQQEEKKNNNNNKEDEGDGDEKKIDSSSSKNEEKKESKIEIEMSKIKRKTTD